MNEARTKLAYEEVSWDRLDKTKAFVYGAGIFSSLTTAMYPLSVIKTRQMTTEVSPGFKGVKEISRTIAKEEGFRGFYRGFFTMVYSAIPARVVYLSTLEMTKSVANRELSKFESISEPTRAGVSSFLGGALASMTTQTITVPFDIINSRQIVYGQKIRDLASKGIAGDAKHLREVANTEAASAVAAAAEIGERVRGLPPPRSSAVQMARTIFHEEGIRGFYKGFSVSLMTFVPSSAVWWSAYGLYQKKIWTIAYGTSHPLVHELNKVLAVQVSAGILAGCTSAFITTPLDLVKTRIQVSFRQRHEKPSIVKVAQQVMKEEGVKGFYRGFVPRMFNASLWGTCMVSAYEFLKRTCQKPDDEDMQRDAGSFASSDSDSWTNRLSNPVSSSVASQ